MSIPVLYEDEWVCIVDKPEKMQTHSTSIDKMTHNLVDTLKDQMNERYYPVHRLDRGTSGILMLAKNKQHVSSLQNALQNLPHKKKYVAIVRGQTGKSGIIVREMEDAYSNKIQFSKSTYLRLEKLEAKIPNRPHPTTFFSFVELEPLTGRTHQLRRHMAKISRPIVGDMEYGDFNLNKFFRAELDDLHLYLHAETLSFWHPYLKEQMLLSAPVPNYFNAFKEYCLHHP
ncbi:MAG: hypothetical protein KDD37_04900 [Bdellovibrionales bacterium]|nr:hypothetical protein [Bdellovibrionales bacterium]